MAVGLNHLGSGIPDQMRYLTPSIFPWIARGAEWLLVVASDNAS